MLWQTHTRIVHLYIYLSISYLEQEDRGDIKESVKKKNRQKKKMTATTTMMAAGAHAPSSSAAGSSGAYTKQYGSPASDPSQQQQQQHSPSARYHGESDPSHQSRGSSFDAHMSAPNAMDPRRPSLVSLSQRSLEHEAAEVLTTLSQGRRSLSFSSSSMKNHIISMLVIAISDQKPARFSQASIMSCDTNNNSINNHGDSAAYPYAGQFINKMGSYPIIHQAVSHLSHLYESSRQSSTAVRVRLFCLVLLFFLLS